MTKSAEALDAHQWGWRVKASPDDFRVVEVLFPSGRFSSLGRYTAVTLKKSHLTTFQAIELLAHHTNSAVQDWQHAGLKDEDGYTTQTVLFKGDLSSVQILALQSEIEKSLSNEQSMALEHAGACDQSLDQATS